MPIALVRYNSDRVPETEVQYIRNIFLNWLQIICLCPGLMANLWLMMLRFG